LESAKRHGREFSARWNVEAHVGERPPYRWIREGLDHGVVEPSNYIARGVPPGAPCQDEIVSPGASTWS
jgi:hypothetical protein